MVGNLAETSWTVEFRNDNTFGRRRPRPADHDASRIAGVRVRPHYRERRGKMSNILCRRMSFSGRELRRICPDGWGSELRRADW